ncbi:MAG TPA: hypothetical protein VHN98_00760 [Acidimicrobiales bacterium]|nr:hypothetical protein [Acidimicrobiales bacterium]
MSAARRNQRRNRKPADAPPSARDPWARVPAAPEVARIRPAADPPALIRSLGVPPLPGQTAVAEHYLAAVVERAAAVATALAASAGLLAAAGDHDDEAG